MGVALGFVLALSAALGCGGEHADEAIDVAVAERIRVSGDAPPAPDDARWRPVGLPDWWGIEERRRGVEGWYRATFRLDAAPAEVWAVYLPRVGQTVGVWVNRTLVGTSGGFGQPLPRNWNRPQLFGVPSTLLRVGENEILIRLVTHAGAPGFLRAFHVGPMRVLGPLHARRTWRQVTLGQIVGSGTLATGLLLLLFAGRYERFLPQRWLALGLVLWSWTSADAFFHTIPVPSRWWESSTAAALVWCLVCFTIGFHRMLERARPGVDRIVVGVAVAYTAALALVPRLWFFAVVVAGGGIAVVIALYLMTLLVRSPAAARSARRVLLLPVVLGVLFGMHDLVMVAMGRSVLGGVLLSPYIPVLAMAAAGWLLLERHLETLRETEALNAELEARVASKHRELEENYDRLRAFERRHAVVGERERIMQDMHDGMGGQLVSTLAMVESGGWTAEQVSEALRDALDDLRIVIDSLDPAETDLLTVLGMVRARLEPRLVRHGLRFRWRVAEVPPLPGFGPEMALQVMRVVQEALTNVVRHARATTVTVRTGEMVGDDGRPGVFVDVEDDGRGIDLEAPRGRGLAGMQRRAARLGGAVAVDATGTGTRVRLWIPRREA